MKKKNYCLLAFFMSVFFSAKIFAQGDDCSTAISLPDVGYYKSKPDEFTNMNSTVSTDSLPRCWPKGDTVDLWLKFKAVGSFVYIKVGANSMTPGISYRASFALYSGSCGNKLVELTCGTQTNNKLNYLATDSLIIGMTYFIRIATNTINKSSFTLSISNYTPTVNPSADCDSTVMLTDKNQVGMAFFKGAGKNIHEIENTSCFGDPGSITEYNSTWLKWTCSQSGTLTFDILANDTVNDIDFIVYELSGTDPCGQRDILRCSATAGGAGICGLNMTETDVSEPASTSLPPVGNGYLKYLDMVAGKNYALFISNASTKNGFIIKFGGTGTFSSTTAVSGIKTINQLLISPNPTSGNVDVSFTTPAWGDVLIEIQNMLGQTIRKEIVKNSTDIVHQLIDLSDQEAGMYVVSVIFNNGSVVRRLVKQ